MLAQKLFKSGNSIVVTIPTELLQKHNLRDGSEVVWNENEESIVLSRKGKKETKSGITPDFLKWLDSFNKQYGPALKELAGK